MKKEGPVGTGGAAAPDGPAQHAPDSVSARAVYFSGKKSVSVKREEAFRKQGMIYIKSACIGISHGTEMLFYRGQVPDDIPVDATLDFLNGALQYPIKYGYVNTGTDEFGRRVFTFFPHQDSFFVHETDLLLLPDTVEFEDAVFIPNMETALSIHQDLLLEPGSTLLISGLGVIGLLLTEISLRRHFGKIICIDPMEKRRNAAEALGATVLDPASLDLQEQILECADGNSVDWAVNLSTSGEGLQTCIDSLGFGGTVIEGSWYGSKAVKLRLGSNFHRNRLRIQSVQVSSISPRLTGRWTKKRRMDTVLSLIDEIKPKKYITHRFPLKDAAKAFTLIDTEPEKTIQTILLPGGT